MIILPVILAWALDGRDYLTFALINGSAALMALIGLGVSTFLKTPMPSGVKPVILAVASFAVAVFISILKSGLSRRLRMCWLTKQRRTAV